jgi:hypothetical protein
MGRTLHYTIKPQNGQFTKKELEKLYDVGQVYQQRCKWTCESLDIQPYNIYPNWENNNNEGCKAGWDKLNSRWETLAKIGTHPNAIAQQLVKDGIAYFHEGHDKPQYGFRGFTKTGGNELNSLQVVLALLAASRIVKNAIISLHDEGKLLRCALLLKNGKAQPDIDNIEQQLSWLLGAPLFEKGYGDYQQKFTNEAKKLWDYAHPHKEGWQPIGGEWQDVAIFLRPIKAEDFEDFPEYNAGQIMAGFDGEYFGLSTEDPESASYRMIAMIQKMLPKDSQLKLEVCPKLDK